MVNTISKGELAELPLEDFEGRIIVVQTLPEAEKAVQYLYNFDIIGFDSETRPAFHKGQRNKIALIQLAVDDTCFLFRTNLIGIPNCLLDILAGEKIKKIGVSIHDDFSAIRNRADFKPENFIELQKFVKEYGIEDNGLQRIYGILFGKRISKRQRLSNWEADVLSDAQKKYAALDAWACLRIYNELVKIDK